MTKGFSTLELVFSPLSSRRDVLAVLDSYAAELIRQSDGAIVFRGPLFFLHWVAPAEWPLPADVATAPSSGAQPVSLRLIQHAPAPGDRPRHCRWPFWVGRPLQLGLRFQGQWWFQDFARGKEYTELQL